MVEAHNGAAEEIREILKLQFEAAAELAEAGHDTSRAAFLAQLAGTTGDIDPRILDAYSELFGALVDSEVQQELMRCVGISWFPEDATAFVRKFIADRTGG